MSIVSEENILKFTLDSLLLDELFEVEDNCLNDPNDERTQFLANYIVEKFNSDPNDSGNMNFHLQELLEQRLNERGVESEILGIDISEEGVSYFENFGD